MQNNISQPVFAAAGGASAQAQDDFDLNEIFAEYFINEFDDPLNAYTSSMANFNGGATAVAMTQEDTSGAVTKQPTIASVSGVSLPTGGIRTVFHGARSAASAPKPVAENPPVTQDSAVIAPAPATKKAKIEAPQPQQQLAQQAPVQKPTGGITLPFAMINHPGMPTAMQAHQQALALAAAGAAQAMSVTTQPAPGASTVPAAPGMVALPVGRGIRVGGITGVAPVTAQTASRAIPNVVQSQFGMWGSNATTGGVSEQAVAERRQRNREHAKRSRVRKKFMLESLQEEVRALQRENQELRMMVQEHIPEHAMKIISDNCKSSHLFEQTEVTRPNNASDNTELERADFSLMQSLASGQQCFVLSDPKLPDNPIVFASPGFYELTGYSSQEVLGRNCRFLQGPGTDTRAIEVIRKAVATGSDATVCLLNYKSDGTPFWNQFFIAALRDSDNCIVNYVGVQTEVEPQTGESALEDKVNAVMPLQYKEP